ncbi:hypothetical protein PMI07_002621 [Rhizobium sp. CF080]|uniref:hypothetical protein n=1 Tax=Rhizobium sp. (strain CF080) TaxID=1144310 RepID=UPI000271577B|nr:hypothetical protein [Rhizobium sp. CF080]EUB94843.1 hypothetical protein PMI07_002621 [Rhizobium sp. CF080]
MTTEAKITWVLAPLLMAAPAFAQTEPIRSAEQHISCSAFYSMREVMAREFGKSGLTAGLVPRDEEHMHAALLILQDIGYPRDGTSALFERQTQQMLERTQSMTETDFAALDRSCQSLLEQSRR